MSFVQVNTIYQSMWQRVLLDFKRNHCECDPYLKQLQDDRRGVTALAFLQPNSPVVSGRIHDFINRVKHIEPDQHYQREQELHLTILSIISCYAGFELSAITPAQYAAIIAPILKKHAPLRIHFKGVTASAGCVLIQGFLLDSGLDRLRNELRSAMHASGLAHTMDTRYTLTTAHITIMRFATAMKNNNALIALCEAYREFDFGIATLTHLDLVFNDWYQSQDVTQSLLT